FYYLFLMNATSTPVLPYLSLHDALPIFFFPIGASLIYLSEWLLKYLFNVRMPEKKEPFKYTDYDTLFEPTNSGDNDNQEMSTELDRKSTRLNSSHVKISYAVF